VRAHIITADLVPGLAYPAAIAQTAPQPGSSSAITNI